MVRKVGMGRKARRGAANRWEDFFDPGEKLLWQGAPAAGVRFSGVGIIMSVFGVFFLAFALFWIVMAASMISEGPIGVIFPLFGLPFVLVGLWLVAGHWFYDAYKRRRTRYALTNSRAIIARTVFGRRMESYPIGAESKLSLIAGDLDTVNFAERSYRTKHGTNTVAIGFRFIKNGKEVYDLMRNIRKET